MLINGNSGISGIPHGYRPQHRSLNRKGFLAFLRVKFYAILFRGFFDMLCSHVHQTGRAPWDYF